MLIAGIPKFQFFTIPIYSNLGTSKKKNKKKNKKKKKKHYDDGKKQVTPFIERKYRKHN
jgi:hypothetical protein